LVVPYAVELGVKIREERGSSREIHGLQIKGAYLRIEEWDLRWRHYQLNNSTGQEKVVLVEHPRTDRYDLVDTPKARETTSEHLRFEVVVPPRSEAKLRVKERRLVTRREELQKQSYRGLQRYLERGLLDRWAHDQLAEILGLWEKIAINEKAIKDADQERQKIYKAQKQVQGNMGALSSSGKEGALRARYVEQLEASEDQLRALEKREAEFRAGIERLRREIEVRIRAMA
jgi:hypothetical protein